VNAVQTPDAAQTPHPISTRLMLRLFPRPWRDRYGAEFGALLDELRPRPSVFFDVLVAALDTRLHANEPARRWPPLSERLRHSELAIFAAWVCFAVAGSGFAKLTEDPPFTTLRANQLVVGLAFDAVLGGAIVSLLALLAAGVPIGVAIALDALRRRLPSQLALLATPLVAIGIWTLLTVGLVSAAGSAPADPTRLVFFFVWVGAFVAAVAAGTVALSVAALNAQVDSRVYMRAVPIAYVAVAGMAVVTVAVVLWAIGLLASDPATFWGYQGILASSTALSWLAIVFVMAAATAVAVRAAARLRAAGS
jgi:hypothetical protein